MLFTTTTFVVLFLPIVLAGFFLLGGRKPAWAALWLFAASLFFYGWWMPQFTLLLLLSIAINFSLGTGIARAVSTGRRVGRWPASRMLLVAGIVFNLGLLAYFKYANFFLDNLSALLGERWDFVKVILPIGISFYTFTQIAFLVDTAAGKVAEFRFVHYGLFVTYFPHLIAGPVLHHAQMMPQFARRDVYSFQSANFAAGLAIFAIGLCKKVVLADGIAPYADASFGPADQGVLPSTSEAWLGAVAYTLQLYFDFSGYSDMAIGLSWMFNIRLPFNFDSPYRSLSISEFWRRWHISLSTFLRDYLYIALGGNRKGPVRRYINLGLTMVLGGLWHGASWSFVVWGTLHGLYLMVNHAFRALCDRFGWSVQLRSSQVFRLSGWFLTLLCVVVAWVFFRAHTLEGAMLMLKAMAGFGAEAKAQDVPHALLWNAGLSAGVGVLWCTVLAGIACLAPNSNFIGESLRRWLDADTAAPAPSPIRTRRVAIGAVALVLLAMFIVINAARDSVSAFIYFNF